MPRIWNYAGIWLYVSAVGMVLSVLVLGAYVVALNTAEDSKSLLSRLFRPFRTEILTIIPMSRPSSPASGV